MSKSALRLSGALIAATLLTGAVQAQTVSLSGNILDTGYTTVIASPASPFGQPGANGDVYTAPLIMTATYTSGLQTGAVQSLFGFCIDIYHEIGVPFSGLSYQFQVVADDNGAVQSGSGDALSATQVREIGYLTQQGYNLYVSANPTDLDGQLAGVQDAIWKIEYPGSAFSFTPQQSDSAAYATSWYDAATKPANYETFGGVLYEVASTGGGASSTQSFAVSSTPLGGPGGSTQVPEPGVWTLMLLGVGALGAAFRLWSPFKRA
jgi:hypothetical protein